MHAPASWFRARRQVEAWSGEARCAAVPGCELKRPTATCVFPVRFLAIWPLECRNFTCNKLLLSSPFHPCLDRLLKVAQKIPYFSCNPSFETWFRPIGGEFEGNDSRLLIVEKKMIRFGIYILPMFGFICKTLYFSRQNMEIINLSLHRFVCRTNQYSKSKFETIPGLISTPQIQWLSQNLETSFH